MKRQSLSWSLAAGLIVMGPAAAQVDLSCVGVQVMSAHAKVHSLPAATASVYAPVVARIESLAQAAVNEVKGPEERWKNAWTSEAQRIRAGNPGADAAAVDRMVARRLRDSADLDNKLAAVLVAQLKAHKAEEQIIVESRQIPGRDNQRQVADLSQRHAESSGASREIQESIQRNRTLQHLVGTLAAAESAARSSQDIPAAPLARLGFDDAPGEARLVSAVKAASGLVIDADARRTGAQLIVGHLERMLGSTEDRMAIMGDRSKETTRVTNSQMATALNELHKAGVGMQMLSTGVRIDRIQVPSPTPTPAPPARASWPDALADKVTGTVSTIYEVVYGVPGGQTQGQK